MLNDLYKKNRKKLTLQQIKEIIYKWKMDCDCLEYELILDLTEENKEKTLRDMKWYQGQRNGFQLVLDLLEKLK